MPGAPPMVSHREILVACGLGLEQKEGLMGEIITRGKFGIFGFLI